MFLMDIKSLIDKLVFNIQIDLRNRFIEQDFKKLIHK